MHFDSAVYTSLQNEMTDIYRQSATSIGENPLITAGSKQAVPAPENFGSAHPFRFPRHLISKISPAHFSLGYQL